MGKMKELFIKLEEQVIRETPLWEIEERIREIEWEEEEKEKIEKWLNNISKKEAPY